MQTSSNAPAALDQCPPLERSVVEFILGLTPESLSAQVRAGANLLLRDQIALQVGCSQLPWSQRLLSFATARQSPGRSRIVGGEQAASAADAAFVNACYGHGFEYDDAHRASASHPGSCVVSAALAIGEELGSSMADVMTALVAGYEVYTRIGVLAAPGLLRRGFHPHAVLSNFGAAAVAAKLYGFDAETTLHALSIALSHASGTTEYTSTGGSIKRIHAGIGTRNGILAAELARLGITGPRAFLTGRKGFFQTFLQRSAGEAPERAFAPERTFEITKVWIKPYCACGCTHAYIDAMQPFAGRLADITGITLGIQPSANVVVGSANANAYTPANIEHVQYSLPVQAAFALHGLGNGYRVHRDYLDGKVDMDRVLKTARLVEMIEEPALDERYPGKFVADVTVSYGDGTTEHRFIEDSRGTPENAMPPDVHDRKFLDLTSLVLGASRAAALLAYLKGADDSRTAAGITERCAMR